MAVIKAFNALRPVPEVAVNVASVPYDVISVPEARELAKGNPLSFLHVVRPEIDLNVGISEYDDAVYSKGSENLQRFASGKYSLQETEAALYAYRLRMGEHEQIGIYGLVSADEYERGAILKHENIRPPKVADRTRHILEQSAHAEPVYLVFKDDESVIELMDACTKTEPLYDFTAEDGIQHTVWKFSDPDQLVEVFTKIHPLYIADGHHRCAAASKVWSDQKIPGSDFFPAVCFPVGSTCILPYNRMVRIDSVRKLLRSIDSIGILDQD